MLDWIKSRLEIADGKSSKFESIKIKNYGDFLDGPVAKTPHYHCKELDFSSWLGNQIPHATTQNLHTTTKIPHATTKAQHSQMNKYFLKIEAIQNEIETEKNDPGE